jgi:hypothetical protein
LKARTAIGAIAACFSHLSSLAEWDGRSASIVVAVWDYANTEEAIACPGAKDEGFTVR